MTRLEIPKDHAYSYAHYAKLRNGFSTVLKSNVLIFECGHLQLLAPDC